LLRDDLFSDLELWVLAEGGSYEEA